jgi:hypothetical protein
MAYLDYWQQPFKRHAETGLITAIFEESFGEPLSDPQTVAPVDLNVAVAVGCRATARLARALGRKEAAQQFEALKDALNTYCWDEDDGAYYNYNVREGKRRPYLISITFDPLREGIASPEQCARLVEKLLDPALFDWDRRPLTSVAKTHPHYCKATGPYDGTAWFGDVWTMRNLPVIFGLSGQGRLNLAAVASDARVKATQPLHVGADLIQEVLVRGGKGSR